MDQGWDFQRAKELAINFLSYRPRSAKEVAHHLIYKGYAPDLAQDVVLYLQEKGYIDDLDFAQKWYKSRMIKGGYGPNLIRRELLSKGIGPEICDSLQARLYPEEDERREAERLAKGREGKGPLDMRRIYRLLLRRGFSSDIVNQIVAKDID